jgi:hypothetical protein
MGGAAEFFDLLPHEIEEGKTSCSSKKLVEDGGGFFGIGLEQLLLE